MKICIFIQFNAPPRGKNEYLYRKIATAEKVAFLSWCAIIESSKRGKQSAGRPPARAVDRQPVNQIAFCVSMWKTHGLGRVCLL